MIKALLFDADGVLFFHADKLFSERLAEDYGVETTKLEHFFTHIFPECIVGKKDLKIELAGKLEAWGWRGSVDELLDYWFSYERNIDQPLVEYVRNLKHRDIPSYVATNNDHYRAEWLFDALNVDEEVFSKLYAAGDMGVAKPEHKFFEIIFDDLTNLTPGEVLFWDDSEPNLDAARKFGIQAELYSNFNNFNEKMKSYV